jgi:hypothetical protein
MRLRLAQSLFSLGLPGIAAALGADATDASYTGVGGAPAIPGRWRASLSDAKEVEVLGSVVLRPREDREAAGFLVGYEQAFVEAAGAREERLLSSELGVVFLPMLIEGEQATRLGDATLYWVLHPGEYRRRTKVFALEVRILGKWGSNQGKCRTR